MIRKTGLKLKPCTALIATLITWFSFLVGIRAVTLKSTPPVQRKAGSHTAYAKLAALRRLNEMRAPLSTACYPVGWFQSLKYITVLYY